MNSATPVHSTLPDCHAGEHQGWYYLTSIDANQYHSFSMSIIISGGRVCEALLGCLCSFTLSTNVTNDSFCSNCNFSICGGTAQSPVLMISLMATYKNILPHKNQHPTLSPTSHPQLASISRDFVHNIVRNTSICLNSSKISSIHSAVDKVPKAFTVMLALQYEPQRCALQYSLIVMRRIDATTPATTIPSIAATVSPSKISASTAPTSQASVRQQYHLSPHSRLLEGNHKYELPPPPSPISTSLPFPASTFSPLPHPTSSNNRKDTTPKPQPSQAPARKKQSHDHCLAASWVDLYSWYNLYSLPPNLTKNFDSGRLSVSLASISGQYPACRWRLAQEGPCELIFEDSRSAFALCPGFELSGCNESIAISLQVKRLSVEYPADLPQQSSKLRGQRDEISFMIYYGIIGVLSFFLLLCFILSISHKLHCFRSASTAGYAPIAT